MCPDRRSALGRFVARRIIGRGVTLRCLAISRLPLMGSDATLPSSLAGFLGRPLMRGALLVRSSPALACNLALLGAVHRCESTIIFCHCASLRREIRSRSDLIEAVWTQR